MDGMDMNRPQDLIQRCGEGITVVSQLARRINASLDLQETLDAIVDAVAELIPCSLAEIDLWNTGQQMLVLQAIRSSPERAFPVGKSFPPGEGYTGWVVRNRKPLLVPHVDAFHDVKPHILPGEHPFQAYIGIPLLAGEELIGALVLVHDQAGAFNEDDLNLLEALAGQAAIAIQNARIYQELSRRHREISALYAIAEAINSPGDMQSLLENALDSVIKITGADAAIIRFLDQNSNTLRFVASRGLSPGFTSWIQPAQLGEGVTGQVALTGEPALISDMLARPVSNPDFKTALIKEGVHARLEVPLHSREHVIGTLGITSHTPSAFSQIDVELLLAIGRQLGVAIENERLRQDALREERLAAVGRVATSVAHDLRSPLGGIMRSAEFLARPEISQETRQKLSEAIVSLAKRLISTSQQILDYVQEERLHLRLAPCSLPEFLDDVLSVLEVDFSDQGIEVIKEYGYLGEVVMDENRMAQVVYNIAANARDAMPQGGKFVIQTRKSENKVELIFADTGPGVLEEICNRIFDPFFSYGKRQGAGLGLSIARHIVEQHEGAIRLDSKEGQGATFIVTLPI
jgi:two-component system NtrC family sensor kinase